MTDAERQKRRYDRRKAGLVRLEFWVPAAVLEEARQAVQDVADDYNRPPQPVPSWAKPVDPNAPMRSADRAADAQRRAAAGEVMWSKPKDDTTY